MSVLWRACVSASPVFSKVRLGPYEERVRQLLLSGETCPETYEVLALGLRSPFNGGPEMECILQPYECRVAGRVAHVFVFGGCAWHYLVTNRRIFILAGLTVSEEGCLRIPIRNSTEFAPLRDLILSMRVD